MILQTAVVLGLACLLGVGGQGLSGCRYSWYVPPTGQVFTLRSPNYPSTFPPGTICYWYLYTDIGERINLNCHTVNLETTNGGWACRDSLSVYSSSADGTYCRAFSLVSARQKMLVSFQSAYTSRGGNFACTVQVPRKTCDCGWSYRSKIVGGDEVRPNEFPSMAALIDARRRAEVCGSTIISPRFVLTAAHCLGALSVPTTGVLVGEHDLSTNAETNATRLYRVKRFIGHPNWSPKTVKNDIALIETQEPMEFSARVGPACLPFNWLNSPEVGDRVIVLGWGTTFFGGATSDVLLKADLGVVDMARCQRTFNGTNRPSAASQICAWEKGKDACQMDSGGPLLSGHPDTARFYVTGLVSFGLYCGGDDPSVYTRVAYYIPWVVSVVGEDQFCKK